MFRAGCWDKRETPPRRVLTIAPGVSFLDCLVEAILSGQIFWPNAAPPRPLDLARYTILVPTRRAARVLARRFSERAPRGRTLLPRIRPLGDVDEDEAILDADEAIADAFDMPAAITPLGRLVLLAGLARDWARDHRHCPLGRAVGADPTQPIMLARALARLIDLLEGEDLSPCAFDALADGDYPEHRRVIVDFLTLIRRKLPEILVMRGVVGPAQRRSLLLQLEAEKLRTDPPDTPIIAAGSTGSLPATAGLLSVIARLPRGAVVLPGLDHTLDAAGWANLSPSHPQYGLKKLLQTIGIEREEVRVLVLADARESADRAALMSEVMRPCETTPLWAETIAGLDPAILKRALDGLATIEAPTPREEALAIAMIMRRAVEDPRKTAALITPNRRLARCVAAELARWDIDVDDSAGVPLSRTPRGGFVLRVLDVWVSDFAPVALLALLKAPLCTLGFPRSRLRQSTRALELALLRGARAPRGLAGLARAGSALAQALEDDSPVPSRVKGFTERDWGMIDELLSRLETIFAPFAAMDDTRAIGLGAVTAAHIASAEAAADDGGETNPLWRGDDGKILSGFLSALMAADQEAGQEAGGFGLKAYAGALPVLMRDHPVRANRPTHPRLAIYGLLEARLIGADTMILGGLNETLWPGAGEDDPWLSRPMRAEIGLPPPERLIGLCAHDFVQAACAREVYLTWSRKIDGALSTPSRFILRLKAVAEAAGVGGALKPDRAWLERACALDRPKSRAELAPPRPTPPLSARPRRLSLTRIEEWIRDPYAIFARYILRLVPLDPIAAPPGVRERGTVIHDALRRFVEQHPQTLPPDAVEALIDAGRQAFAPWRDHAEVMGVWWPRFQRLARWFIAEEKDLRKGLARSWVEQEGRLVFEAPAGPFSLSARADRIDRLDDGTARVIDYKTGTPPSKPQVEAGLSPQLPLEAEMLRRGAFKTIGSLKTEELVYIHLTGGQVAGEVRRLNIKDVSALAEATFARVRRLVARYDDPAQPYVPRAVVKMAEEERDYDHFSRFQEWSGHGPKGPKGSKGGEGRS